MTDYQIEKQFLVSESDVEQKVVYPLLTNAEPFGLGYDRTEIQTKNNLQKLIIDKGQKAITYYPDYLLIINGIPSIVVEAKKPGEDMLEAFRQAALYAGEVNRKFDRDINPCKLIIACDGFNLLAGTWDSNKPFFEIETSNWLATDEGFSRFCSTFTRSTVEKMANGIKNSIRTSVSFKRPLNLLGGLHVQNKSSKNTFGETLSIQYRHLFNPNIEEERIDIVNNAYVKVMRHESHVSPIDRLIRKKILPSSDEMTILNDSSLPTEILRKIKNASS